MHSSTQESAGASPGNARFLGRAEPPGSSAAPAKSSRYIEAARDRKLNILRLVDLLTEIDEWEEQPTDDLVIEAILLFTDIAAAANDGSSALRSMLAVNKAITKPQASADADRTR